jgi:hypothetical protein
MLHKLHHQRVLPPTGVAIDYFDQKLAEMMASALE